MIDWTEVIVAIIGIVITAIIVPWINSKTKNEQLKKIIIEVGDAVAIAADSVAKTYVDDIKAQGVMTDADKAKALSEAVQITINNISKQTINYFKANEIEIETYIKSNIEAYLKRGY